MKEAVERRVIWKGVDEKTFTRFSQYVYAGDYSGEKPSKRNTGAKTPSQVEIDKLVQSCRKRKSDFDRVMPKRRALWHTFLGQYTSPLAYSTSWPSPNDTGYDYTGAFLCHARMYVFADYYGISALQHLVLAKLREALTYFNLYEESYGDINQLIQYCFEQTVDKRGQTDKLRSLVCLYAACKVEGLWKSTEFRNITRKLPDFYEGLITATLSRLD